MAYSFDQVFAADPANPSNIAQNASITIFAPGDGTMTPIAITDPDGQALANPIPVNANGFGSAFRADIDRVAWLGGGFTGFFTSYEGMKEVAVAAQEAAETAATDAEAAAATTVTTAVVNGSGRLILTKADTTTVDAGSVIGPVGPAGANGSNVLPTDTAIKDAINNTASETRGALNATIASALAGVVVDAANFGTARTHVEINAAIAALPATGGKVLVRRKDGPWSIGQRIGGDSSAGGIYIDKSNVTIEFDDTQLNLTGACDFIKIRGLGGTPVVITADVAATDTTFTVTSSAGFQVGQDVFCRLGASAYDPAEPSYWIYAKVTAVPDGTHVTIDRPAGQSLTVAGVSNTALKSLTVLTTFPQNVHIAGTVILNNPMTGGANAEAGIYAQIAKNVQVDRVIATNPGAGAVLYQYVDQGLIGSIKCTASAMQNGQTSKGRVLNLSECRGVTVGVIDAENFEGIPIWTEARTEGCSIGKVVLSNTHATRSTTSTELIATIGEATLSIESVVVTGKPSYFHGTGGSAGNYFDVQDAYFYTSGRPIIVSVGVIKRNLYIDQKRFNGRRRTRKVVRLMPGMTGASAYVPLPNGIYAELLVNCPSTVGINYFAYGSTGQSSADLKAQLVNGGTAKFGAAEGLGAGYPLNAAIDGKTLIVGTNVDGSTPPPAGSYIVVEYDYFPDPALSLSDRDLIGDLIQNPGREIAYVTAAPTTGYHYAGAIAWNSAPSAGGPAGWMCVASGTPGTWKAMANLAA